MECSICFEEKPDLKLGCGHKIHQDCFKKLLKSNIPKKCPMCRYEFDYSFYCNLLNVNNCDICNQQINVDAVSFVKNTTCGCIYHFNCLRQSFIEKNIIDTRTYLNCPCCTTEFNRETLETKSFTMFVDGFFSWVGTPPQCRHISKNGVRCDDYASPRKYYLCNTHCDENHVRSNRSYEMALTYIFKFAFSVPEDLRLKYFCRICEDWDDNVNRIKNKKREEYKFDLSDLLEGLNF